MKTKKTIIAICSLAVVLALIATASFFAIFANRQKAETSITTGIIKVDLQEEFRSGNGESYNPDDPDDDDPVRNPDDPNQPPYTGDGAEDATKVIKGYNSGTQPAYVRVRIFPTIETESPEGSGNWNVHGGIPVNYISYDHSYDGWVDGGDGYWYYTKILYPGETTSEMTITNLSIELTEDLKVQYGGDKLRVNMLVTLESCQASNQLYRQNWNLDSLPAGVEQ